MRRAGLQGFCTQTQTHTHTQSTMSSTVVAEKTEEELRKEIDELHRQQREVCKYANIYVENHDFLLFNLRLIVPNCAFSRSSDYRAASRSQGNSPRRSIGRWTSQFCRQWRSSAWLCSTCNSFTSSDCIPETRCYLFSLSLLVLLFHFRRRGKTQRISHRQKGGYLQLL